MLVFVLLIAVFFAAPQSTSADTSLKPVGVGDSPQAVVVNPVTNKIYVANGDSADVTVIDGASCQKKIKC